MAGGHPICIQWVQTKTLKRWKKVDKIPRQQKLTCFHQHTRSVQICQGPCRFGTPRPSNLGHELGDIVGELETSESPSNISSHLRRICTQPQQGMSLSGSLDWELFSHMRNDVWNADCHITVEWYGEKITFYGELAQCVDNPHCCKPHQKLMPLPSSLDPILQRWWHLRSFCLTNPV